MELNLKGKIALVTGGSKGIGLVIKKALEKEGVIVISWSKSEGHNLENFKMDTNEKFDFNQIDILINNVGGRGTWNDPRKVMELNYFTMEYLTHKFLTNRVKTWGRVITISSIYGKEKGNNPLFDAAKSAQIGYMKNLAGRFKGITLNTICPGHIDVGKEFPDESEAIGNPNDVANLVVFLCSDLAKHINGACITVDGGESHSF